jgi:hypothetical protein
MYFIMKFKYFTYAYSVKPNISEVIHKHYKFTCYYIPFR